MHLLKRVGMLYGKNDGTPLCQEFHYELISTWPKIFIVNVVVIDLTRETMASSVISRSTHAIAKLNAIVKTHKYKRHHFIPMAMEVHNTPWWDMDRFIRECARLFHDKWLRSHLSLSFCIQFFKWCVNIALQLAFAIHRKIALAGDVCSRPSIIIKSHDLHVGNIRKAMGEIVSYHEKD